VRSRVESAVLAESVAGTILGLRVRRGALIAIAALVAVVAPFPALLYHYALIVGFLLAGEVMLWRLRRGLVDALTAYGFVAFDMALLAFTLMYPNPMAREPYPAPLTFQFNNFVYFLFCRRN